MKSQMGLEAVKYLIIALVIAASLIFGYKAISAISRSNCLSQLTILESDLKDSVRVQATDVGSREALKYDIPCDIDYIFAVDFDKKDDEDNTIVKESFFDFPIIQQAIEAQSENLFVVRGKEVTASSNIGKLDITYPYYECYRVKGGRLGLMLEGRGLKTGIKQLDPKYDCTLDKSYSLLLAQDDENDLCDRASLGPGCSEECLSNVTVEQTDDLTITIDPCTGASEYWSELPKCVAQGLAESLVFEGIPTTGERASCVIESDPEAESLIIKECDGQEVTPGVPFTITFPISGFTITIQNADPLMVWHFSTGMLEGEKIIYYLEGLQEEITAECLRDIQGVVTDVIVPGALSASLAATPTTGTEPLIVSFTCTASGGSGTYTSYDWDFGDTTTDTTAINTNSHQYAAGTYTARCTVTDDTPATSPNSNGVVVTANNPPEFTAVSDSPDPVIQGNLITFSSTAFDPDMGDTVTLFVCDSGGATALGCTAVQYCTFTAMNNPSCTYTAATIATINYQAHIFDNNGAAAAANPRSGTFTVVAPDPDTTMADCTSPWTWDTTATYLQGADVSCCGNDNNENYVGDGTANNYASGDYCCGGGNIYVIPDGTACITTDPCETFILYWSSGVDDCGLICTNKGLCGSNEICDANSDCDTSTWTLTCDTSNRCSYCGNNIAEGAEVCDGTDVRGYDCTNFPGNPGFYTGGTLDCSPSCLSYDESGCTF